ncbi:hypothetical protein [Anaerorhabdus furcosa]|uniref:Uncharacterized protein n=1 Tax=Anaerorhabdus furcosa TaxID=118967 RepID=A0A1T4N9J6_9FIRM|nr:hypothetical protein [Anaerorhabdus furcosa]SJZ75924.1 hypothetical protein SAMN02745191_1537 [Anaerorhabdus furcosa]
MRIRNIFICVITLLLLTGCTKEKYVTEVFSDNLKMRTYNDRVVYDFNESEVVITIRNDDSIHLDNILEISEYNENSMFTLAQAGDLVLFIIDDEDKSLGANVTITKQELPKYHELYKEVGEYKIGYMTLPGTDQRRSDLLDRLDIKIK